MLRWFAMAAVLAMLVGGMVSCSSGDIAVGERNSPASDVAATDGGPCNSVVNGGATIEEVNVAAAVPAPAGGTFADGTYYLTKRELYTGAGGASGPTGHTRKEAVQLMVIRAGLRVPSTLIVLRVGSTDGAGDQRDTFSAAPTTASPTTLTIAPVCGAAGASSLGYTANALSVVLFDAADGSVSTFTRQLVP